MADKCNSELEHKFMQWFSRKVSPSQLTDYYYLYKEIEKYCLAKHVIRNSLFEIQSYAEAQRLTRILSYDSKFQRTFSKYGRKKHIAFTMFELFYNSQTQANSKNIVSEHDKEDISSFPIKQPNTVKPKSEDELKFETLLDGDRYNILRDELEKEGINSIEALKKINLWEFMNQRCLYSVQSRLAVANEISNKIQDLNDDETNNRNYVIHYGSECYSGSTPSNVFLKLLKDIAVKYPLKFRTLIGMVNPDTNNVLLHRFDEPGRLKLINPTSYIDSNLSVCDVEKNLSWILKKCSVYDRSFSIDENNSGKQIEPGLPEPQATTNEKPTVITSRDIMYAGETDIQKKAEELILKSDLEGLTYDSLQIALQITRVGTKAVVEHSQLIIEIKQRLFHRDSFVDFDDGANELEDIIDKLIKKNNGIVSSSQLYEFSRAQMTMFLNDNGINDQQAVFDFAKYLFGKLKYHGKYYVFKSNTYISLPESSVDSNLDILCRYAREEGTSVTYDKLEDRMKKIGLNTGNLRGTLRIDREPIFFIYKENEYLLAELIGIDDAFLDQIKRAVNRLFDDIDDHYVILRQIDERWYELLPALPGGLEWTPLLLQQILRYYSQKIGARTIQAMDAQNKNTLHAMLVRNDSPINDFRDAVATYLYTTMPDRKTFRAEELRQELVKSRMISGNQLIYNMPKALGGDPRFIWSGDGERVTVRFENG